MSPPEYCHVAIEANATDVMNKANFRFARYLHRAGFAAKLKNNSSHL
jgi:hypothetical protein